MWSPRDNIPAWVASQRCKPTWRQTHLLQVDILQSTIKGPEVKALPLGSHSTPILTSSPIRAPLPKVEGKVSMTTEVREFLSLAVLHTSGHALGSSTSKRLEPMVLVTPLPPNWKISPNQWIYHPSWVPQMMLKWRMPPWRKSLLPLSLQPKPQGPAVIPLP